jgi:tRNA(adenine34) deaminase
MTMDEHLLFLEEAIKEAELAAAIGEVPIGAVVVCNGEIVGRGHNLRERDNDPTAHAEICALRDAGKNLGTWRLENCTLYVTMEPCPMCCGALVNSRIERAVIAAHDAKTGALGSVLNFNSYPLNHKIKAEYGLFRKEAESLMSEFFAKIRAKRK